MSGTGFAARVEQWVFGRRKLLLVIFLLATVVLFGFATQTKIDAGFEKQLPQGHPYIGTFTKYQSQFGGANRVMIALMAREGDIFTPEYFTTLEAVTQEMYGMPGVDQSSVTSLFTPNVRFTEVVEDGFTGGNVVPSDFTPTPAGLAKVRENALKSNYMGRLVTDSFNGTMVMANLLDIDPGTGERLDTFALAKRLEALRVKHESDAVSVHIIGFAKVMGDVRDGALNVVFFFGVTVVLTSLLVWFYAQSFWFAALPLGCSISAVAWQLGLLNRLGYGIDVDPRAVSHFCDRREPRRADGAGVSRRAVCGQRLARSGAQCIPAAARAGQRGVDHGHDRVYHHPAHPGADDS